MTEQQARKDPEQIRYAALLKRLDQYADVLDSRFQVPGTRMRFGLDGLIGLVPVVGDVFSLGLSLYLVAEALRIQAPASVVRRMVRNVGLDFLVGLVPVVGDALDFAFKANLRNAALLRDYAQTQLEPEPLPSSPLRTPRRQRPGPLVWVVAGLGALLLMALVAAL